jgi:hypothetical protein
MIASIGPGDAFSRRENRKFFNMKGTSFRAHGMTAQRRGIDLWRDRKALPRLYVSFFGLNCKNPSGFDHTNMGETGLSS